MKNPKGMTSQKYLAAAYKRAVDEIEWHCTPSDPLWILASQLEQFTPNAFIRYLDSLDAEIKVAFHLAGENARIPREMFALVSRLAFATWTTKVTLLSRRLSAAGITNSDARRLGRLRSEKGLPRCLSSEFPPPVNWEVIEAALSGDFWRKAEAPLARYVWGTEDGTSALRCTFHLGDGGVSFDLFKGRKVYRLRSAPAPSAPWRFTYEREWEGGRLPPAIGEAASPLLAFQALLVDMEGPFGRADVRGNVILSSDLRLRYSRQTHRWLQEHRRPSGRWAARRHQKWHSFAVLPDRVQSLIHEATTSRPELAWLRDRLLAEAIAA